MHLHLPKPLHGWREFAGEVAIIVLGVLIALTFEALVEHLTWQRKVTAARTELRYEIGQNLALLNDRMAEQPCVERRIDELAATITKASASARLAPLGQIGTPRHYTWPISVWESQLAAQTMAHFPADEAAALSRVYRYIGAMHELNSAEVAAWSTLDTMAGPGRRVDPASVTQLLEALEVARRGNSGGAIVEPAIRRVLAKSGLGSDFPQLDPRNPPVLPSGRPAICNPIGPPQSTY